MLKWFYNIGFQHNFNCLANCCSFKTNVSDTSSVSINWVKYLFVTYGSLFGRILKWLDQYNYQTRYCFSSTVRDVLNAALS